MGRYQDDAVLVTRETTVRESFSGYLARLGSLRVVSTGTFARTEDAVFFEATAETAHGVARVYDAFALRDGQATHHVAGVLSFALAARQDGGA